jgi:hypothetical protein
MYALLCERVYNCHLDNDTERLVTEPLYRNGRLLRFRYNPAFSGTPQYILILSSLLRLILQIITRSSTFSTKTL